ncbi:hypothetical protein NQ318_011149 [Aromia moschata]|uniref:Uncharacterized protein n=1 Tax=Aromia moschata TaxID=1265417 RepID=A0AAV8YJ19_9CUCU|nr:hypothetical protein NQ318_011149 [Aromia moschata]
MQPLDVAVYGPFKSRYKQAMNNWLTGNPGKPVTIYEVAEFVNPAFSESFTISNICKSFEKTGIYPFNSNIFTDDDFLPSSITDRPDPSSLINDNSSLPSILQSKVDLTQSDNILDQPSTSSDLNSPSTSGIVNKNITKEGREELGIVSPEMELSPIVSCSISCKNGPVVDGSPSHFSFRLREQGLQNGIAASIYLIQDHLTLLIPVSMGATGLANSSNPPTPKPIPKETKHVNFSSQSDHDPNESRLAQRFAMLKL